MLLLVVIIVWALAVGGCLVYAGVCGVRTFRRVRAARSTIQSGVAALRAEGLGTLEARAAELSDKVVRMQAALERLEHSLAGLRVLTGAVGGITGALLALRRVVRR